MPFSMTFVYSEVVNISSFHTHTRLCRHASGDPVDYVLRAEKDGCSALGISDHCPYPDGTWSGSRMNVSDLGEYINLMDQAKVSSPFPLYTGFECEWHPVFESWYRDHLLGELGANYLVYGAHWVQDAGEFWYIAEVQDKRLLHRYVDLTVQGIMTGLYSFMAHPDLFLAGYTAFDEDVRAASRDIIQAAITMNLPLEINGLGLQRPKIRGDHGMRYPYPVREFWELASFLGARVICNSDAHRSEDVIASCVKAREFAAENGIAFEDTAIALGFLEGAREKVLRP